MNSVDFATNTPDAHAIGQMRALLDQATCETWLLIDTPLLKPDALVRWLARSGATHRNAYQGSALEAFGDHAPGLVKLHAGAVDVHFLESLAGLTSSAPAVSFLQLQSQAEISRLQRVLAHLATVKVENREKPVHCRIADTRVLPHLLSVLDPVQTIPVAATVAHWCWYGRVDGVGAWRPDQAAHPQEPPPVLSLTIEQFRAMQHAAEADGIYLLLRERVPELVPHADHGHFHTRLQASLAKADEYALSRTEDRLQFVVLSLSCGDAFHCHPHLAPTWGAIREGGRLVDQIKHWDDTIWTALQENAVVPA